MNLAALVKEHDDESRALYERGRWISWAEVRRRSDLVHKGLARIGVGIDDRVAISWPTSSDFVYAYLGALSLGAVAVPVNPNSPPRSWLVS